MANYVSYANATELMTTIGQKFAALNGAYVVKGNTAFASLPSTLTAAMSGYVYNITDDFTTDSRFVEGAGKDYPAGTNVVIVNLGDATTPDMKFDVIGSFIDVDALEQAIADVSAMISSEFDDATAYSTGDLCVYEGDLYIFTTDHAAGAWTGSDVSATTVDALLDAINSRVTGVAGDLVDVREMICDDVFSTANAYSVGDVVVKDNVLYKFKAAHTAGDPWSSSEVDAVTVLDLIESIVPGVSEERFEDTLTNFSTYQLFDPGDSYEAGDRVWYETEYNHGLQLYEFVNDHTGAWDDQDVSMIDLTDLIAEAEPDELTTAQVNTLIGLLD